jgi:phosphoenolpyruvate-protein kinase (PTS system EI component)
MASDPLLLRLLIGCGLTEFSMTPGALLMARRVVLETSAGDMARIAARVMTLGTVEEIESVLVEHFGRNDGSTTARPPGSDGGRQEVGTK